MGEGRGGTFTWAPDAAKHICPKRNDTEYLVMALLSPSEA